MKLIFGFLLACLTFAFLQSVLAGEITYYFPDASGSPVLATDAEGNIIWREHYQPYGEKVNEVCPSPCDDLSDYEDIGYTGHEYDAETGLTYMQARYYDPVVGRFLAIDPIGFKPGKPMTFNRYSYANNNPYKYVDPDGENVTTAFGGILYESYQFAKGNGFNGEQVMGALADGYNGSAGDFAKALGQDVMNFVPAGAALKVVRVVGKALTGANVAKRIDGVLTGANAGRKTKGKTSQFTKQGGINSANKDFASLKPTNVKNISGGKTGSLGNSQKATVRSGSTDGRPTLEIQNGKKRLKIRYDD